MLLSAIGRLISVGVDKGRPAFGFQEVLTGA